MRIQTDKRSLTAADLQDIIAAHAADFNKKSRLKRYYNGGHDILKKTARTNTDVNNRLVANFPAYITNMSVGFFLGQPVTYKAATADEHELEPLLEIFKYNDEAAHNLELAEEASITGEAFEFLYIDSDARIRFATVPSEEVVTICDETLEANVIFAIRHYRIYALDRASYEERVDVYDDRAVTHYSYSGGDFVKIGSEAHYFGDVPVVEYPNNRQRRGDFEDVISLVDSYNMAQSLTMDDLADFTDAFLVLKGVNGTTAEEIRELRRNKVLFTDGDGDASWLIKNLNDTYVENIKRRLQDDIHKFSGTVNMSDDNFAGNASGVAIRFKLMALEQIRSKKEREFKKALQRRIELISGILKVKGAAPIDFRDIDIRFTSNVPQDLQSTAQVVSTLDGLVSRKTLLSLLPFIEEPRLELEELEHETYGADDFGAET